MATRKAATTRKATTTRKAATKAAKPVQEELALDVTEQEVLEPAPAKEKEVTVKSQIEEGITSFLNNVDIDNQKARYKAQRAIAFQAFKELIESGEFDALVERAIANVDELPAGWTLQARKAAKPAAKAEEETEAETPAKQVAKKPAAKRSPRRRPARKAAAQ